MELDASAWSGEGAFTQLLIDALRGIKTVSRVRIEDVPSSRAEPGFSFISNEMFVTFRRFGLLRGRRAQMTLSQLEAALSAREDIGPADYSDSGMLQYLRAERIVPPYQTRGYKLIELVRVYEAGAKGARSQNRDPGGVVS